MTKILLSFKNLPREIKKIKSQKKSIVLTTGVFDLLHSAHEEFLDKAKLCGDVLIVGLETDARVKKIKGEGRPVETLEVRIKKVSQVTDVDYVFALPREFSQPAEHEKLIAAIRPNVFAVSAHSPHLDKKKKMVEKYGGRFEIVMEQDEKVSTSQILAEA